MLFFLFLEQATSQHSTISYSLSRPKTKFIIIKIKNTVISNRGNNFGWNFLSLSLTTAAVSSYQFYSSSLWNPRTSCRCIAKLIHHQLPIPSCFFTLTGKVLVPGAFDLLSILKDFLTSTELSILIKETTLLQYLEENYPQKPLLPSNPQLRAINLQASSIVTSSIQPLHMMSLLNYVEAKFGREERVAWVQTHIEKGFAALEKLLKDRAGVYSTGDAVYMADVFLAPQIAVAAKRFNVDMSKFPTLDAIYESCAALPEFQASLPERQPDAVQ